MFSCGYNHTSEKGSFINSTRSIKKFNRIGHKRKFLYIFKPKIDPGKKSGLIWWREGGLKR